MTTSAAKANRNAAIVDRLEAENARLRAALIVAFNRMPTYALDADDLRKDRGVVQNALGIGDAACIAFEQTATQKP